MGRILVVDDERSIRVTLKAFLDEEGHEVETAEEAEMALAILEEKAMDVVVTDIILPKVSGVQLLQRIRDVSPDVLVIMMTGEPTLETASESLRHGAVDYLQKPVGKADITKAVKNALQVKHLNDEKRLLEQENRRYLYHLEELVAERTRALTSSEAALRRRAEELAILNRLAREVGASMTVDATIRAGMRHIFDAVSPDFAVTFLLEDEELVQRGLHPDGAKGRWQPETAHRVGECLCGLCINEDRAVYSEDIHSDDRCTLEECRRAGFRSFAALKLRSGVETLGVLGLASVRPREFKKEGPFLEALGDELAVGVKKSLLYEQLQQRAQEIQESLTRIKQGEAERQQLELRLRQSQKMEAIGTLAGGIAHDFNNILTPIIGFTEITMSHVSTGSKVHRNMKEILTAANRAQELVKQILTFSRQTEYEKKSLIIEPVIKEVMKLLRSTLPTTIEIRQNITKETRPILADPTGIHQVLMNLSMNAYHAMRDKGGVLSISVKEMEIGPNDSEVYFDIVPGTYLRITVSDTGHGIPKEMLDNIFSPYFTTKPEGEGTGLGLSVAHGIVKSHGGRISVHSEPGKGTTFHVFLPVLEVSQDSGPAEESAMDSLPRGNERILLVDDEEQILFMIHEMLSELGYEVTVRKSGNDAYESFRSQPGQFDLVITDQTMPGMTGVDLTRKLLRIRPQIPVILCTGYSETISEKAAKLIGIQEYLMKPVVNGELAKIIRNVLDRDSCVRR